MGAERCSANSPRHPPKGEQASLGAARREASGGMDLSRPDRSERLDRLAAEFALGTLPPRPRARLARAARAEPVVATAIGEWEQRLAALATAIPAVTPPPRVWTVIVSRLGLSAASAEAAGDR